MKIAIISDIHSNLEALSAALESIKRYAVDAIYCLGDIVGYCADPGPCLDLVREYCTGIVKGNHDEAVSRGNALHYLPRDGQIAAQHNFENLTRDQLLFLDSLPLRIDDSFCTYVHATPHRPDAWLRLDSFSIAQEQFQHFTTNVCFMGHTHIPAILANRLGALQVRPGNRYLINVGSVGQPRDLNPRMSFGIFDTGMFTYENVRVSYNVEQAANRILEEGLPPRLAQRLKTGR